MTTAPEWLDAHLDRVLADQRARIASAQLVATFAVAIAGGLLAAAMHRHPDPVLVSAVFLFAFSFVAGSGTFLLDRAKAPDVDPVLGDYSIPASALLDHLRVAAATAARLNKDSVQAVQQSRNISMALASCSIVLSLLALAFGPGGSLR